MRFDIGDRWFELGDVPHLPQGQREFCEAIAEQSQWTVKQLVERLGLKSPAPLESRLNHLMQRGVIKELTPIII